MSSNRIFRALAVSIAALALCACGNGDQPEKPDDKPVESADLLICTFNIRYNEPADGQYAWDYRKDAVCKFILTRQPDVLALQEVQKDQAEFIVSKVKDEYGFYALGNETGKDILSGNSSETSNAILYRKSRFDLLAKDSFWHNDPITEIPKKNKNNDYGNWHMAHPCGTSWVKLADKDNVGRTVWAFATHYINSKNTENAAGRRLQTSNIHLSAMPGIIGGAIGPGCKDPVFFMGDFNAKPDTEAITTLVNFPLCCARNDAAKSGSRDSITDNCFGQSGSQIIDYIFFCGPLKALTYTVDKRDYGIFYISDHYPVLSEFSYSDK